MGGRHDDGTLAAVRDEDEVHVDALRVWVQDPSSRVVDEVLDLLPLAGGPVLLRLPELLGESEDRPLL